MTNHKKCSLCNNKSTFGIHLYDEITKMEEIRLSCNIHQELLISQLKIEQLIRKKFGYGQLIRVFDKMNKYH